LEDIHIALRILTNALEVYPFATAYLFNIAVVLLIRSRFVDAILILRKLHVADPTNMSVFHNLIFATVADKEWYKDIIERYDQLQQDHPDVYPKLVNPLTLQMINYAQDLQVLQEE
jgi:Flp pilus assembly protein TadD